MKKFSFVLALFTISMFALGCDDSGSDSNAGPSSKTAADDSQDHDGHAHTAPHGGHLIDLGREHKFHAELLDNHDTDTLTVYVLDGDLKSLSIKQPSINLTLTSGDQTESFDLAAATEGNASEFKSNDEKMMGFFDAADVKGKLRVTIDGTPFTGSFDHKAHDHAAHNHDDDHDHGDDDHKGHDHDGDDHDGHDHDDK